MAVLASTASTPFFRSSLEIGLKLRPNGFGALGRAGQESKSRRRRKATTLAKFRGRERRLRTCRRPAPEDPRHPVSTRFAEIADELIVHCSASDANELSWQELYFAGRFSSTFAHYPP